MSDATREQIARDAEDYVLRKWWQDNDQPQYIREWTNQDFSAGAAHQYPIGVKDGYNLAIDVVKQLYVDCLDNGASFMEELEKLKKP